MRAVAAGAPSKQCRGRSNAEMAVLGTIGRLRLSSRILRHDTRVAEWCPPVPGMLLVATKRAWFPGLSGASGGGLQLHLDAPRAPLVERLVGPDHIGYRLHLREYPLRIGERMGWEARS